MEVNTDLESKIYAAIDLKSFYASVECIERGLDPLTTNLVVADESRTEKTICLAVSPSLKSYDISGRARLFEVVQRIKEVNIERLRRNQNKPFRAYSDDKELIEHNQDIGISYIVAEPRMAHYIDYSTKVYQVYLKYIAPDDIHVYSIDEVFLDVTYYTKVHGMKPDKLVQKIIRDIYDATGLTATGGIGSNLYLAKVAMDILAKHEEPDEYGVRIAQLDEIEYRKRLWNHKPLTDFWRVGKGYQKKLEAHGMFTMGDVARCSIGDEHSYHNEELLYKLFGINAELLIDHAWGYEPTTISLIKAYKPDVNCISSGQVLQCPYSSEKARLIVKEMIDLLALDLVEKRLVTDQLVLTIGYDIDNLINKEIAQKYTGEVTIDHYGRAIPKHSHGTMNIERYTNSSKILTKALLNLYDSIINTNLLVRRITIVANRIVEEGQAEITYGKYEQMDLFTDYEALEKQRKVEEEEANKERKLQEAMLQVKKKYGKNAILKGMNFEEGAMTKERNRQIGGHKA